MLEWTRVTDFKPYVEDGDFDDAPRALPFRLYSPKGKRYPLLSIRVYSDWDHVSGEELPKGIRISTSFKSGKGQWWDDRHALSYVPFELLGDLAEMLGEAKLSASR